MEAWEETYKKVMDEMTANPPLQEFSEAEFEPGKWYKRQMENCICAGGSKYCMYLKKGTSNHLIVFMIGGGLSWNDDTARLPGTMKSHFNGVTAFYTDEVQPGNDYYFFYLPKNNGLFSLSTENKFANWNIACVNYGTADFHIGQSEHHYINLDGEEKVLHHHGYANFTACLEVIEELFPKPEKLIIAGESAGAFAVPAIAEDVIKAYSKCQNITVYSDSALMLRNDWPQIVNKVWKAPTHIAEGVKGNNILVDFYRHLISTEGNRVKYLFSCGVEDAAVIMSQNYVDTGKREITPEKCAEFRKNLAKHLSSLKGLSVNFGFYIHDFKQNGMGQHCTLATATFNEGFVEGVSPMDWLWNAVDGKVTEVGLQLLQ